MNATAPRSASRFHFSAQIRGDAAVILVCAAILAVVNIAIVFRPPDSGAWLAGPLHDDAYYYLTIARNAALRGEVAYDGNPTTGFQPLYLVFCIAVGELAR